MKVVRARTGASAVGIPSKGVIYVDPDMGHDTAVGAIRAILPDVHPDAVHHWVEEAIPTALPLDGHARKEYRAKRRARRARRVEAVSGGLYRLAALACAAAIGGFAVTYAEAGEIPRPITEAGQKGTYHFHPAEPETEAATPSAAPRSTSTVPRVTPRPTPTPTRSASAWSNATFVEFRDTRGWTCVSSPSDSLAADCTTTDGLKMHFEAWLGPGGVTHYTVTYRDGWRNHRVELKVFPTRKAMLKFLDSNSRLNFPNLVAKENWMLYGSDPARILTAAQAITETGRSPQPAPSSQQEFADGVNDFLNRMR